MTLGTLDGLGAVVKDPVGFGLAPGIPFPAPGFEYVAAVAGQLLQEHLESRRSCLNLFWA